jgi:hypothetical protein
MTLPVSRLYSIEMNDDIGIWKGLEEGGYGQITLLSWYLSRGTEENNEKYNSG